MKPVKATVGEIIAFFPIVINTICNKITAVIPFFNFIFIFQVIAIYS